MNLAPAWVQWLEAEGHEALHWSEVGRWNASDVEIMSFARDSGRIVLTNDLDFGALLAATGDPAPSVVQIRSDDLRLAAVGPALRSAPLAAAEKLASGALVSVEAERFRIRVLPIR